MASDRDSEPTVQEEREIERAADRFGARADEMEQRSDQLGEQIEATRQDWQRKRADERVPGANPPDSQEEPESEEEPPEEASFPSEQGGDGGGNPPAGANP